MATFSIRSSTIRLGIFISTLIIAVILVFQLIWLKKVYRFEQKEFDRNIIKVIRGLYEDINASVYYSTHLNKLIENPEPHLYIAQVPLHTGTDSLVEYLHYELEDFDVFTDCHIGIYSAKEGKYIYKDILESAGKKQSNNKIKVPDTPRSYDHLTLYFPNRREYILSQMDSWIISSILLLFVLLLFSGSLYYFYRQKFLNEIQKDFIHNFTHEFKTPVSVISLAADVLKNPEIIHKPEKLTTYSGIIEYQSQYLQNQTEKLLKFAHDESSQLHLSKEKVNIHNLIQEAVANLTPLIDKSNSKLSFELNAEPPFLTADRDYLIIVIINLIDNAVKYSKKPQVTIRTGRKKSSLFFSVADNGIGIEKKQVRKIFRKFFRFHQGDIYPAKGFGIGLSFVKKIIDAHGGKIKVESTLGKGSVFTIELPA